MLVAQSDLGGLFRFYFVQRLADIIVPFWESRKTCGYD